MSPNDLFLNIAPAISGYLLRVIGFNWLFYSMALLNIIYAPLILIVRNIPPKLVQTSNEHQVCPVFVCITS